MHTLKITTAESHPEAENPVVASPQGWCLSSPHQYRRLGPLVLSLVLIAAKESAGAATGKINWVPNGKVKQTNRMLFLVPGLFCSGCYSQLGWVFLHQLRQSHHFHSSSSNFFRWGSVINDSNMWGVGWCIMMTMPSEFSAGV